MDGRGTGGAPGEETLEKSVPASAAESGQEADPSVEQFEGVQFEGVQKEGSGETPSADDAAAAQTGGLGTEESTEIQRLQAELEQARAEKKVSEDQYLRLRAEFENFRRRTRKEAEEQREWATANLVSALLPVVDNLERATQAGAEGEAAPQSFIDGVDLVRKQLLGELERVGARAIEAVGNPFDPTLHEAVLHEESDEHPDGHVIEEFQRGYTLGDKVLRASVVKVAKGT